MTGGPLKLIDTGKVAPAFTGQDLVDLTSQLIAEKLGRVPLDDEGRENLMSWMQMGSARDARCLAAVDHHAHDPVDSEHVMWAVSDLIAQHIDKVAFGDDMRGVLRVLQSLYRPGSLGRRSS